MGAAVPSWAYTLSVTNETGIKILYDVNWGLNFGSRTRELNNGQTDTFNNDDWHNKGLCWENLEFRHQLPGCFNSPRIIFQIKCGDVKVLIRQGEEYCSFVYSY